MPHFFKPNKLIQFISDSEKSEGNAGNFSNTRTAENLLTWIHSILDRKNEPSNEIKKMLVQAFELLRKSALSSDSIQKLNRRLQNEETPAAKAVSEAHNKVNQLRSTLKPTPSIFNKPSTASLMTHSLFKPKPSARTTHENDNVLRFR